jgi:hypothetical protein
MKYYASRSIDLSDEKFMRYAEGYYAKLGIIAHNAIEMLGRAGIENTEITRAIAQTVCSRNLYFVWGDYIGQPTEPLGPEKEKEIKRITDQIPKEEKP